MSALTIAIICALAIVLITILDDILVARNNSRRRREWEELIDKWKEDHNG